MPNRWCGSNTTSAATDITLVFITQGPPVTSRLPAKAVPLYTTSRVYLDCWQQGVDIPRTAVPDGAASYGAVADKTIQPTPTVHQTVKCTATISMLRRQNGTSIAHHSHTHSVISHNRLNTCSILCTMLYATYSFFKYAGQQSTNLISVERAVSDWPQPICQNQCIQTKCPT